jgi:hypothetical protein
MLVLLVTCPLLLLLLSLTVKLAKLGNVAAAASVLLLCCIAATAFAAAVVDPVLPVAVVALLPLLLLLVAVVSSPSTTRSMLGCLAKSLMPAPMPTAKGRNAGALPNRCAHSTFTRLAPVGVTNCRTTDKPVLVCVHVEAMRQQCAYSQCAAAAVLMDNNVYILCMSFLKYTSTMHAVKNLH